MNTPQTKTHLLVIGGTGFIGYHLIFKAKKIGWKVTSVSLNRPKKYRFVKGVKYLKIDISNNKKLEKSLVDDYTYVVNLGGYVNHSLSEKTSKKMTKVHFLGLVNLTNIFIKKKIKKFIQIGSSAEYGNSKAPQNEKNKAELKSSYALSKFSSNQFLLMLYNSIKFPVSILRLFQVYGPKQDLNRVFPQIIKGCLENKKFPVSSGNQIRDFCHVNDVIKAIFLTLKSKKNDGEIFNIASGKPMKVKNTINQICKIIGQGKPNFGKVKYRKDENMKVYADIKKAKRKLKWKPKINFKDGIKKTINSFSLNN